MAQAESINTAIRELLSRGRPLQSANRVRAAHTEFVAALAENAPRSIPSDPDTDCEALLRHANHLQKLFAALHVYLTAIFADIAEKIPGSTLDRRYLDHLFQQFDALGVIRNAAAEIRVHENWRVS